MIRVLSTLTLLAGITACAGRRAPVTSSPSELPAQLRASLSKPERGSLRFTLNRPAYVAVFEVIPHVGVRMLYPFTKSTSIHDAGYAAELVPRALLNPDSFVGHLDGADFSALNAPHYFFLVASLHAMGTSRFVGSPSTLFGAMGSATYSAWDPHAAMRSIVSDVLHMPDDTTWVSDSYVVGPADVGSFYGIGD